MAKRKSLSKRIRFEVLKRDLFKCQYCGASAPDTILHVDHIVSVKNGGTNDIINLVTSCADCNLGKSHKKLSDNSELNKQRKALEIKQGKISQIHEMANWRKSLKEVNDEAVKIITKEINSILDKNGKELSENALPDIYQWVNQYSLDEILDAVEKSAYQYYKNKDSFNVFF